jgi:putative spermidine/putrescine transport system permease protein/spermidine/putrescine transport system permease protein
MRLPRPLRWGLATIAGAALLVLYGPLLLTVLLSFLPVRRGRIVWGEPGLGAYAALFRNRGIGESVINTLLVGTGAVAAALVLGTMLAFWYQARPGRQRELLQAVLFLPFLLPPIVTGLSLLIYFRELGVPRSLWTVGIGHTVFVLALVYRIVLNRLQTLRPSLVEASADLGASHAQTFRHVILPHLGSAMAGAAVLAFALSFDETMITLLVTGTESTLPMRLWGMMRTGFTPDINALVALLLAATTLVCLLVARLMGRRPA